MAEIKKYLDTTALSTLVDQIKSEDAKGLQAAKDYADGLAKNYDVAGAAATAKSEAIADADAKFATVNENIAKKADTTALEAEVTRATEKEAEIVASVEAVDAKAVKNAEDIAAINNEESGILAQAKKYADDEDAKVEEAVAGVEEDVANLTTYVGTIPEGATATNVVAYVQEKTAGIATDAALGELQAAVDEVEADVATIKGDYLKAADKTELEGKITAEEERAAGVESGLDARIKAVEDDYLVEADKTELANAIALKADKTALDAEIERATGVEESLQTQINTIMNNPDAEGAINSINEFTAYVEEHGTIADGFRTDIDQNKADIAAEVKRAGDAEAELAGRLDVLEAIDHEAYVAADTALKNELNTEIAKKANAADVEATVEALEQADADLEGRLADVEAVLGTGEGSVADQIEDAKDEAIAAAAEDAANKDVVVLAEAQGYADELNAAMEERVAELEGASATHALTSDVTALAGRVTTAEGEIDTLQTEMDAVEAKAAANETAIGTINTELAKKAAQADLEAAVARIAQNETDIEALEGAVAEKAEQDDLDAAVARITANEAAIAANTSAINSFTAITPAEVEALFA